MTALSTPPDRIPAINESLRMAALCELDSPWPALPVLSAPALIERAGLDRVIPLLRIRLGFPRDVFALSGWPLIAGYAEFVQLMPVFGSRRYGGLGGQLSRGHATALRALDYRRGQILPRGAAPEIIGEHAHRWTYAVFVAALLRDVEMVCAGSRVWLERADGSVGLWDPASGPMSAWGAVSYRIEPVSNTAQTTASDPTCALRIFERHVPDAIRAWLSEDPRLLPELTAVLAGGGHSGNPIGALVTRAAGGSRPASNASLPARVEPKSNLPDGSSDVEVTQASLNLSDAESLDAVRPEISKLAHRFMQWLQQGIASGALALNVPGALIHGVNEGLLLASPRIFRKFAKEVSSRDPAVTSEGVPTTELAKRIQREVLRVGWHVRAERGVNILCYEWQRGEGTPSRLHGIVLRAPERFLTSVPPVNRALVRVVEGAGGAG